MSEPVEKRRCCCARSLSNPRRLAVATALLSVAVGAGAGEEIFKASEKANVRIILKSSEEETDFYVSGTFAGRGKLLPVKIEKKQKYDIKAEPPGCRARDDTISPPYRDGQEIEFQFMIKDCAPRITVNEPAQDSTVNKLALDVEFTVQSRSKLADLSIWLNGEKLASESAHLARQLAPSAQPAEAPGGQRTFRVSLKLRPGPNTIKIEAMDRESTVGSASVSVDYEPPPKR